MRLPWVVAAAVVLLVILRSFVFVFFPQSHFDSDQAVIGLMALDLAQLNGFPLFFYGQHYLLGVEAWLAAPLFALFGSSVVLLKLPLLILNIAAALLLVELLRREEGLTPWRAFTASIFFILPPVIASSRLVEAQGGNIEPFLYILLLWIFRARPVLLGFIAGIGFLNREFTAYGILALLILDIADGGLFTRVRFRHWLLTFSAAAVVIFGVHLLEPFSLNSFGKGAPVLALKPPELLRADWYYVRNYHLRVLFGMERIWLTDFNILSGLKSTLHVLPKIIYWTFLAGGLGFLLSLLPKKARAQLKARRFLCYLLLAPLIGLAATTLFTQSLQDLALIRYSLLCLWIPVAVTAFAFRLQTPRARALRAVYAVAVFFWILNNLLPHMRLLGEYLSRRPPDRVAELAAYLQQSNLTRGLAEYDVAYQLAFRSGGDIAMDTLPFRRILHAEPFAAQFMVEPGPNCRGGALAAGWCVGRLP